MWKRINKKIAAFSLVEIALTIIILGITISSITPIWQAIHISKKMRVNEEKFHYIRLAMQGYLLQHGYLPNASSTFEGISQKEVVRGYVPYKTLGISKDYAFDSNNRPFSFVVNKNLVQLDNVIYKPLMQHIYHDEPNSVSFCRLSHGSYKTEHNKRFITDNICNLKNLTLLDQGKSVVLETDYVFSIPPMFLNDSDALKKWYLNKKNEEHKICNTMAWLIISHGLEGNFHAKKNKQKQKISKCKQMNTNNEQEFCLSPESDDDGLFNDTIFYQTRFDMAAQSNCPCTIEPTKPRV